MQAAPAGPGKGNRSGGVYGGRTDLSELDGVGMAVAISFECRRLRAAGWTVAGVFDPNADMNGDAFIFDVSTKESIDAALQGSPRFKAAVEWLAAKGVNPLTPGFDVLTLDPAGDPAPQRLIELKSSGVNARLQEMTWNEWKSASDSALRDRYYPGSVHVLMVPLNTIMPSVAARKPCSDADRAPIASPSRPPLSMQARGAGRAREVEVFRNAVRPVVADANVHLRACLARIASTHVITGRPSRHEVRPPSSRPKPSHVTR